MPDSLPPIRHPARFVPMSAVATGQPGEPAVPVSAANPVPCSDQPLRGARALAADIPVLPGLAVLIDCSAGGRTTFVFSDSSSLELTLSPGLTLLPFAVTHFTSTGQTAAFNAWVLS